MDISSTLQVSVSHFVQRKYSRPTKSFGGLVALLIVNQISFSVRFHWLTISSGNSLFVFDGMESKNSYLGFNFLHDNYFRLNIFS